MAHTAARCGGPGARIASRSSRPLWALAPRAPRVCCCPMPELREVELRIAVAEGVLSRAEADALGEEARRKKQSPLALLVEQGRLSEDSFQSILAEAMNDPMWRAAGT